MVVIVGMVGMVVSDSLLGFKCFLKSIQFFFRMLIFRGHILSALYYAFTRLRVAVKELDLMVGINGGAV